MKKSLWLAAAICLFALPSFSVTPDCSYNLQLTNDPSIQPNGTTIVGLGGAPPPPMNNNSVCTAWTIFYSFSGLTGATTQFSGLTGTSIEVDVSTTSGGPFLLWPGTVNYGANPYQSNSNGYVNLTGTYNYLQFNVKHFTGSGSIVVQAFGWINPANVGSIVNYPTGGSGSNGTVTSAALSAINFFSVTGSPITTAGTFNLGYATGLVSNEFEFLGVNGSGAAGLYAPFSLTTTGSSGPATFNSGTLNIPQYSGGGGGGSSGYPSILTYGSTIVPDGIARNTGTMAAGSAVLNDASASFVSGDVGKYIEVFGAGHGGYTFNNGSITAATNLLNDGTNAPFQSTDVGRWVTVIGAGPTALPLHAQICALNSAAQVALCNLNGTLFSPANASTTVSSATYYVGYSTLEATITTVNSATQITLNATASAPMWVSPIEGISYVYGTNLSAAVQTTLDAFGAAGGGTIVFPPPTSCPSTAVACGYMIPANNLTTNINPASISVRYSNVNIIGSAYPTNIFTRGAWAVQSSGPETGIVQRGNAINIGDPSGTPGTAGEAVSNVSVSGLHFWGLTDGNTYNLGTPSTSTGDGWDITQECFKIWQDVTHNNITINNNVCTAYKGEHVYSGQNANTIGSLLVANNIFNSSNASMISTSFPDGQYIGNKIISGLNGFEMGLWPSTISRQIYKDNTISLQRASGVTLVSVDTTTPTAQTPQIQITGNSFDTIGQINGAQARAAVFLGIQSGTGATVPLSNETISNNTLHDSYNGILFYFAAYNSSNDLLVSNNLTKVDLYGCGSYFTFSTLMNNVFLSDNRVEQTANAVTNSLYYQNIYYVTGGATSNQLVWSNVVVQGDQVDAIGSRPYYWSTTTGVGWGGVANKSITWIDDICRGCSNFDVNSGWQYSVAGVIYPFGPEAYMYQGTGTIAETINTAHQQTGGTLVVNNTGGAILTFSSDSNMSLPGTLSIPVNGASKFRFSEDGKWHLATNDIGGSGGSGTVTSAAASFPTSLFNASGCSITITTTGTFTCSYATGQTANQAFFTNGSGAVGWGSLPLATLATQAADSLIMNATVSTATPTAVVMPTCTSGADLYNTSTHSWSCVSTSGGSGTVGSGTTGQFALYSSAGTTVGGHTLTYSDVVATFGSGSCSGYLKNDGTCSTPSGTLPSYTGNAGYLTTNGSSASWGDITTGPTGALCAGTGCSGGTPGIVDVVTSVVPTKTTAFAPTGQWDLSGTAAGSKALRELTSDPGTCVVGETYLNTSASPYILKACTSTNTWVAVGGSGGGGSSPILYAPVSQVTTLDLSTCTTGTSKTIATYTIPASTLTVGSQTRVKFDMQQINAINYQSAFPYPTLQFGSSGLVLFPNTVTGLAAAGDIYIGEAHFSTFTSSSEITSAFTGTVAGYAAAGNSTLANGSESTSGAITLLLKMACGTPTSTMSGQIYVHSSLEVWQ